MRDTLSWNGGGWLSERVRGHCTAPGARVQAVAAGEGSRHLVPLHLGGEGAAAVRPAALARVPWVPASMCVLQGRMGQCASRAPSVQGARASDFGAPASLPGPCRTVGAAPAAPAQFGCRKRPPHTISTAAGAGITMLRALGRQQRQLEQLAARTFAVAAREVAVAGDSPFLRYSNPFPSPVDHTPLLSAIPETQVRAWAFASACAFLGAGVARLGSWGGWPISCRMSRLCTQPRAAQPADAWYVFCIAGHDPVQWPACGQRGHPLCGDGDNRHLDQRGQPV